MDETRICLQMWLKPTIIVLNEKLNGGPNKNKDEDEGNDERVDEERDYEGMQNDDLDFLILDNKEVNIHCVAF